MHPDLTLFALPTFEGRQVRAGRMKLTGATGTAVRPLHIGDELIVIPKVRVVGVDHTELTEGKITMLARVHKLALSEAHELPDGEDALEHGRQWSRGVADAQRGEVPLWDAEDVAEGGDG